MQTLTEKVFKLVQAEKDGGTTSWEIAEELDLDIHNASAILANLAKQGRILREKLSPRCSLYFSKTEGKRK